MERISPVLMGGMTGMIGLVMVFSLVQAQAPRLVYICPICGMDFAAYESLYAHFTGAHPTEPIEIVWD